PTHDCTLSLHDALPIYLVRRSDGGVEEVRVPHRVAGGVQHVPHVVGGGVLEDAERVGVELAPGTAGVAGRVLRSRVLTGVGRCRLLCGLPRRVSGGVRGRVRGSAACAGGGHHREYGEKSEEAHKRRPRSSCSHRIFPLAWVHTRRRGAASCGRAYTSGNGGRNYSPEWSRSARGVDPEPASSVTSSASAMT